MKFLLDENLPKWLAADLRGTGLDALDVREVAKPGLIDDAVYQLARRTRRHLISANYKDFGNPLLYPPTKDTGIAVVRMPKCSVMTVVSRVMRFAADAKQEDLAHCLIVLEPSRQRRRKLG